MSSGGPGLPAAMLVDLDDTVLASSHYADRCLRSVCAAFSPQVDGHGPEALYGAIKQQMEWFWSDPARHREGRLSLDFALPGNIGAAFSRLGIEGKAALVDEIGRSYLACRQRSIRLEPGAVETLERLRGEHVRLALVTNGNSITQTAKIERFGLIGYFDYILIEGEFGRGKPDSEVYVHALDRLDTPPEQAWMVGDNLEWEVAAPQRLGIFSIWIDVAGQGLPDGSLVRPDRIIRKFSEIFM